MSSEYYFPAKRLKPIHLFTETPSEDKPNLPHCLHVFPDRIIGIKGFALVSYNLLEVMAQDGYADIYDLLIGWAIPAEIWKEMVAHPWGIYRGEDGATIIEIKQKSSTLEYTLELAAQDKALEIYLDFLKNYKAIEPCDMMFFSSPFLTNLAKLLNHPGMITRFGTTEVEQGDGEKKTLKNWLYQFVEENNHTLSVYQVHNPKEKEEFPFGQMFD